MSAARCYCGQCGNLMNGQLRFCDQCGSKLDRHQHGSISVHFGPVVEQLGSVPHRIEGLFGDYVLLDLVGEGGMGYVFRAMHRWSGQQFAIKMVSEELRFRRGLLEAFGREAETQAQIVHPNVVRVFQFAQDGGRSGLVMELVRGVTLGVLFHQRAERGVSQGQLLWLAGQMALGLTVVHDYGYVHADIKPSNFLFGTTDQNETVLKIADFGIARSLRAELTGPKKKSRSGTPGYMSPEQIRGEQLTPASDLYSLGCVFYEVVTGCPVFPLDDWEKANRMHLECEPRPIAELRPDAPQSLVQLVQLMLCKEARHRPRSAQAVFQRLQEIVP